MASQPRGEQAALTRLLFNTMPLHYLIFDASDDGDGTGTWEAMASVRAPQLPAVLAEVQAVLAWAEAHAPGLRGPTRMTFDGFSTLTMLPPPAPMLMMSRQG